MLRDFDDLIEKVKSIEMSRVAVANANDREVLKAIKLADDIGFIEPILVGNEEEINLLVDELDLGDCRIENALDEIDACERAIKLVRDGEADILMKGHVNTSIYMKAILNRDKGLRTDRLISLLAVYDIPEYSKLLYCTDSGVNVSPDLKGKIDILSNALGAVKSMGILNPKVAVLTANEMINPKIQSTVDADSLVKMVESGEIEDCIIEGPIAFDVAFDPSAAKHKGIDSKVAGDVDLLMFSCMETGNALGKSWLHFNKAKWAGILLGTSHPVILGSRSDTAEIKLNSIALACLVSK